MIVVAATGVKNVRLSAFGPPNTISGTRTLAVNEIDFVTRCSSLLPESLTMHKTLYDTVPELVALLPLSNVCVMFPDPMAYEPIGASVENWNVCPLNSGFTVGVRIIEEITSNMFDWVFEDGPTRDRFGFFFVALGVTVICFESM